MMLKNEVMQMVQLHCKSTGQFLRTRKPWSLSSFDDGFIWIARNGNKRMKVLKPDHPRASNLGYIFRSIVAYEAYHGYHVTPEFAIHHKNGDTLDDSKENLEKISFGKHTELHSRIRRVDCECKNCGRMFKLPRWRITQRKKEGYGVKFCSQCCYREFPKSKNTRKKQSESMKLAYKEGRK